MCFSFYTEQLNAGKAELLTKPLGKMLLFFTFLQKDVNCGWQSQLSYDKHYLICQLLSHPRQRRRGNRREVKHTEQKAQMAVDKCELYCGCYRRMGRL